MKMTKQKKENRIFKNKNKIQSDPQEKKRERQDWMPMNGWKASQTRPQSGIVRVCREEEETQTQ